jgi:cytochrome P450/ferredoxin-NADP reductase
VTETELSVTDLLVNDFDHHSAECRADPVAYYAAFREECPVGRSEAHGGFVYTTRYADVVKIARDDETFSSTRASAGADGISFVIPVGQGLQQFPIELDPPESIPYRDLISPLLTPSAIERLRPMITRHATAVVDRFIESGSCDLVMDLTNPIPTAVTLDWLGFPESDWARLAGPIHDIFATLPGTERSMKGVEGLIYMDQRIRELVRARQSEPNGDGVSALVNSRKADGTEFTETELVSVIGTLVAGGVDTTTSLTGSTLVHLARHPDQRRQLIESPDLLDSATDEFLRAFAPSQSMARSVTKDAEVGGCPMHAGDRVLMPWVAANHDPAVFADPDEVKLDRDASRHLSFGIGSHRCVGAHLARAMFREMMSQVLTRLPDYRIDEAGLVGYPDRGNQTGWDAIPAQFTPGPVLSDKPPLAAAPRADASAQQLTITSVDEVATDVIALTLAGENGAGLPPWRPGAHLDIRLPSGRVRQYSLCGDPAQASQYRIAVLRELGGRGGSAELHNLAEVGATVSVRALRNHFPLVAAEDYLLLAGGIGVTPLLAMVRELVATGARFTVVYGGRTGSSMAFTDDLRALAGDRLTLLPADVHGLPDLESLLDGVGPSTEIYCCGPGSMISDLEKACTQRGLSSRLHLERFSAGDELEVTFDPAENTEFEVTLARTGKTLHVPASKRLIEVVAEAVPGLSYDCEKGYCGACETSVISGVPEHRDSVLTEAERAAGASMMICVGRCHSEELVLDL